MVWVIVILVATNLSMGLSFWYHRHQEVKAEEAVQQQDVMPSEQRARFFREQLNLNQEQLDVFRELNREFNRSARKESQELEDLRLDMVEEMGKATPSQERLDSMVTEFGGHHSELKQITRDYYLKMKAVCDSSQQEKLKDIFLTVSKSQENVEAPSRGKRYRGKNRN